jgi:hypothetical protein
MNISDIIKNRNVIFSAENKINDCKKRLNDTDDLFELLSGLATLFLPFFITSIFLSNYHSEYVILNIVYSIVLVVACFVGFGYLLFEKIDRLKEEKLTYKSKISKFLFNSSSVLFVNKKRMKILKDTTDELTKEEIEFIEGNKYKTIMKIINNVRYFNKTLFKYLKNNKTTIEEQNNIRELIKLSKHAVDSDKINLLFKLHSKKDESLIVKKNIVIKNI